MKGETNGQTDKFISPAVLGNKMDTRPFANCTGYEEALLDHKWDRDPDAVRQLIHHKCEETTNLYLGKCRFHCDVCKALLNDIGIFGGFSREAAIPTNKLMQHRKNDHGFLPTKTHTGNGTFQGAFAFTLTKSPGDNLTEDDMIKAVMKVMGQKSNPVKRFVWYIEYGDEEIRDHPHIHGMYETNDGGRVEAKHWKRAWPVWNEKLRLGAGFRGGYHRPVRVEESYLQYVAKCGDQRHDMYGIDDTSCKIEDE